MSINFEKSVLFHQNAQNEAMVLEKIKNATFDEDVETYIYELTAEKMSKYLMEEKTGMLDILLRFMECDESHAQQIIQAVDSSYQTVCGRTFQAYDPFAVLLDLIC